jgi:hypothetical protein
LSPSRQPAHHVAEGGRILAINTEQLSPRQIETTNQILDLLEQHVDKGGTHEEFVVLLEDTSTWLQDLFGIQP